MGRVMLEYIIRDILARHHIRMHFAF